MKGDKECEDHKCDALSYCTWGPEDCMGKPWGDPRLTPLGNIINNYGLKMIEKNKLKERELK